MRVEQELANIVPQKETLLTVGVFDGVHLGHHYLIEKLIHRTWKEDLISGVVTFNPHPHSVLYPCDRLPWLSSLESRVNKLQELGVSFVVVLSFTPELAQLNAREFTVLLKKYLKMRGLMIGPDFALGRGREGDASSLRSLGQEIRFTVETVPPFKVDGKIVSSTLIRQALSQGEIRKVKKLMGGYFSLSGKIISADKRGQALGFPTANLDIEAEQALPGNGVYATITYVDGRQFVSATNIGTRPTFGESKKTVETYILDYEGNLYGKEIEVGFVDKLRDEKCFASAQELKAQIEKDVEQVRTIVTGDIINE